MKSEDMTGTDENPEVSRRTLHIKKRGMNSVLAADNAKSRLPDHTMKMGKDKA